MKETMLSIILFTCGIFCVEYVFIITLQDSPRMVHLYKDFLTLVLILSNVTLAFSWGISGYLFNFGIATRLASDAGGSSLHCVTESVSVRTAVGCKQRKTLN